METPDDEVFQRRYVVTLVERDGQLCEGRDGLHVHSADNRQLESVKAEAQLWPGATYGIGRYVVCIKPDKLIGGEGTSRQHRPSRKSVRWQTTLHAQDVVRSIQFVLNYRHHNAFAEELFRKLPEERIPQELHPEWSQAKERWAAVLNRGRLDATQGRPASR